MYFKVYYTCIHFSKQENPITDQIFWYKINKLMV